MNAALLIDAENFSHKHVQMLFDNLKSEPDLQMHLKLAFGDWTLNNLNNENWKSTLNKLSIRPQHLFNYTKGKNASDIQLVIHAMNILHTNQDIDTFILATSDSDFTPLVLNLKEYNKTVIGFGCGNCSKTLFDSCDKYIILKDENKSSQSKPSESKEISSSKPEKEEGQEIKSKKCTNILREIWKQSRCDQYGWVTIDNASKVSKKALQDFSPSKYGCSTLTELIEKSEKFEIKKVPCEKHTDIYFRGKDRLSDGMLDRIYQVYFKNYESFEIIQDSSGKDVYGLLSIDIAYKDLKNSGLRAFDTLDEFREALFQSNLININKDTDTFTIKMGRVQRQVGFLFLEAFNNVKKETNESKISFRTLTNEVRKIEEDFTASKYEIKQLSKFVQDIFFFDSEYIKDENEIYFKVKYEI